MAAEKEIIREFLVSLGFRIEPVGAKRFTDILINSSKLAGKTSAVIFGVAVAAEQMVQVFARSMERMFYVSTRTKASVDNLQAMQFAFKQIGLEGEDALSTVEAFARGIRMNPGVKALIEGLGVQTGGRDRVQVLYDVVEQLSKLPHFVGAQFAEVLGIPEHVFIQMKQFLPDLRAAEERRRQMSKDANLDMQAAAAASREYMNVIREVWERVEILGQKLAIKLLPYFRQFVGVVNEALQDFSKWTDSLTEADFQDIVDTVSSLVRTLLSLGVALRSLWSEHGERISAMFWVIRVGAVNAAKALLGLTDVVRLLVERKWTEAWERFKGAFSDMLAPPVSDEERAANAMLDSKAGGGTRKRPGSPEDFPRESAGERLSSAIIALAMVRREYATEDRSGARDEEMQREMGRLESLVGNLKSKGILPSGVNAAAAMAYDRGTSVTLNQNTNVNVQGGGDPAAAARAVGGEQGRVNGDLVRNLVGAMR